MNDNDTFLVNGVGRLKSEFSFFLGSEVCKALKREHSVDFIPLRQSLICATNVFRN